MRIKLFLRFFAVVLPIALVGGFVTEIGNDLNWQWDQWRTALTGGKVFGSVAISAIIAGLLVRLEPRSGQE